VEGVVIRSILGPMDLCSGMLYKEQVFSIYTLEDDL